MSAVATSRVVLDLPEADYHSSPGLSASGAKYLLRSPALYAYRQANREVKDAFDVGSAVHMQVLGTGWPVDVHDFDNWRTKAAQEARDESRANGRIPVLERDYAPVLAMSAAVLNHPIARGLFELDGSAEVSCFADDPETGVPLRSRIDWLPDADPMHSTILVDLKTARTAEPERFARAAADYGYDVQEAFYRHVLGLARGDADTTFLFVVVENEPPHLVSVIELDDEYAQIGRQRMRRAIDLYAECTASGEWPGYEPITHLVGPPRWLAFDEGLVL